MSSPVKQDEDGESSEEWRCHSMPDTRQGSGSLRQWGVNWALGSAFSPLKIKVKSLPRLFHEALPNPPARDPHSEPAGTPHRGHAQS